jgi:hypothetical protein
MHDVECLLKEDLSPIMVAHVARDHSQPSEYTRLTTTVPNLPPDGEGSLTMLSGFRVGTLV